jgi:hypothetical protein
MSSRSAFGPLELTSYAYVFHASPYPQKVIRELQLFMEHGENASAAVVDEIAEAAMERRILEEEIQQLGGLVGQVTPQKLAQLLATRQEALQQIDHPPSDESDEVPFSGQ